MILYEKYRPRCFDDFIGQDKIIKQVKSILGRPDFDREAFWIQGPSGTGKTSLAWIIARQLVKDDFDIIEYNGDKINKGAMAEIERNIRFFPMFGGWKVYLIDEAHSMNWHVIQSLLTLLENLPPKRLFIFTTTESVEADLFGNFTDPFRSRCQVFTFSAQGLAQKFAEKAREIACKEGLNGKPEHAYYRLVQRCHNNMRMVIREISKGEMI